jgi:signal transduction histidine kinase
MERQFFRIAQEALTNVRRHADAQRVSVVLQRHDGHVQVIVEDDGRGFDVEAALQDGSHGRLGLRGMRERAELIGGALTVESSPGAGTAVVARVKPG